MYDISSPDRSKHMKHWEKFRLFSRQIVNQPMNMDIHTQRIMTAMELEEKEPLQGALADMFFGCWFDTAYFGERVLEQASEKLNDLTIAEFKPFVANNKHIGDISHLATRWSVLITPTMQASDHQLRISQDDSRTVAKNTIDLLLEQIDNTNEDEKVRKANIKSIEDEFFAHCLACEDRLAFSIVWWELAKNKWDFHEEWRNCRVKFEQMNENKTALQNQLIAEAQATAQAESEQPDNNVSDDTNTDN